MAFDALPMGKDEEEPLADSTTPRGSQELKWEVVAKTAGLVPAQIIAERLQAEGLPARAWQEGAGQAIGLIVGLLGTGYVIVPRAYLEQARAILAAPADESDLEELALGELEAAEADFVQADVAESDPED